MAQYWCDGFGISCRGCSFARTDEVLHVLKVYPPWGKPMFDPRLNLLALSYRVVYSVIGSYIAAKFAPRNPMRHALILGAVGFVLSLPGAVFIATHTNLGPVWYPVSLVVTALPCAWLGGVLYQKKQLRRVPPTSK
jgi:hypothetical protein